MKQTGLCILLSFVSIVAYSQQTQPAASSAQTPDAGPSQAPASSQPFLHGESVSPALASHSKSAGQPDDVRGQLDSLAGYLAGRRGLIEIPPNAPAGWSELTRNSSVRLLDDRGNSMPDWSGNSTSRIADGFKTGLNNGLLFRATETDPASPTRYTGFMNMQFHYTAAKGGINNYNGKTGAKTDYFNILATSEMRTVGQKWGISSDLTSFSGGDTLGIQSYIRQFGGYDTNGDEQTEGVRVQAQQGSAANAHSGGVFEGAVSAINAGTLTYSANHDENTLGENRIIRDLDRSYGTGSITAIANSGGSPNTVTVTGSGTHWSELGSHAHTQFNTLATGGGVTSTSLAFCFDPLKSDGYDTCFPVSEIVDNNHLTLNLLGAGSGQNTPWPATWPVAGGYHIYAAAWPTSIDLTAHTLTAPDLSGLAVGDRIDQVFAYNTQIWGAWLAIKRHNGLPGRGGGVDIRNFGTSESPRMESGVAISGGFDTAIDFQFSNQPSGVPNYLARFYSDPGSKIMLDSTSVRTPWPVVALWRLKDASGGIHTLLSFQRETATACVLDTSLCVSAKGAVLAKPKQLGQSESNDYAGTIEISGGSSEKVNFGQPFRSNPVCTLTPTSDPSEVGAYWVSATRSSLTANVRQSGRISFNYICVGNPD